VSLPLHWAQGTLTVWATALEGTDKVSAWTGSALKTPSPCSDVSGTMSIAAAAAAKASGFSCMVGRRVRVSYAAQSRLLMMLLDSCSAGTNGTVVW